MHDRNGVIATALAGLTLAVAINVRAQAEPPAVAQTPPATQTPPTQTPPGQQAPPTAPPQPPPAVPGQTQGEHGGQTPPATPPPGGQPRQMGRFPAHQRPPADPAVVARGKALYAGACAACHGADARGGQLGGVNLLRSQLVLNDNDGELILPVVQNGRPGTQMPPIPMPAADVQAVAKFLHSLQAQGSNQGGPPPGEPVVLDILVGDAKAGAAYFAAKCATCHSPTGDMKGIGARIPDAKILQNTWVSGGGARMRGAAARNAPQRDTVVTAKITTKTGETAEGRLVRLDDFLVTIAQADGTQRTFRRRGDDPAVAITDPLAAHRELLGVYTDKNMHDVTAYLASLK